MYLIAPPDPGTLHPILCDGTAESLSVNSTLSALPLFAISVPAGCPLREVISLFKAQEDLPGVIIYEDDMLHVFSRRYCLESLLHIETVQVFLDSPVRTLLQKIVYPPLTLSGDLSILTGARKALKRSPDKQNEPLLISHRGSWHLLDSDTLNVAHWHIRGLEMQIRYERLQMQILESEKMASLGRLVDGVAHEILDPVSFIWGNLTYIANYSKQQSELLQAYEAALSEPTPAIEALREDIEIDYLRSDLPAAVESARSGAHRLRQLATSLQNFCHIDAVHPRPADINTLIDSTLRLLKSRLTTPITIERSYGKLPPVLCFSGQLGQVFMNIFINIIDVLLLQIQIPDTTNAFNSYDLSTSDSSQSPKITVTTSLCTDTHNRSADPHQSRWLSVIISDNGPGILPETKAQILESFSTDKRLRKETGLAMSYRIITAKHGGKFWLRSVHKSEHAGEEDRQPTGTEFEILLPLIPPEA